jgi:hypothetical protein
MHQPIPEQPPVESFGPYLAALVHQQQEYSLGCKAGGDPGDLAVVFGHSITGNQPPEWFVSYTVLGRAGGTRVPATFSADRREATVTISDPALAGHPYFCAMASSGPDETGAAYFPGFEPLAPVLGGPADGALFRGTMPDVLDWAPRVSSGDWVEIWNAAPTPGGQPLMRLAADGQGGQARVKGTRTGTSLRFSAPLADGVYWWGVTRFYGLTALRTYKRFEVGPPDLTTLTLARSSKRGSAKLTVKATRGATGTLVVKRGARTVKTLKFAIKTATTSPQLTVPLPCSKPGSRYTAKVTASDRYGKRLTATKAWTVSRSRCAP